jgi:hypothetical protein
MNRLHFRKRAQSLREGLMGTIGRGVKTGFNRLGGADLIHKGVQGVHNSYMRMTKSGALPWVGAFSPIHIPGADAPYNISSGIVGGANIAGKAGPASTKRALIQGGAVLGANEVIKRVGADDKRRRFGQMTNTRM